MSRGIMRVLVGVMLCSLVACSGDGDSPLDKAKNVASKAATSAREAADSAIEAAKEAVDVVEAAREAPSEATEAAMRAREQAAGEIPATESDDAAPPSPGG